MDSGSFIGAVLDKENGSLQHVIGVLVVKEGADCVLAIPHTSLDTADKLSTTVGDDEIEFALIRVPAAECFTDVSSWRGVPKLPTAAFKNVRKTYYAEDLEGIRVSTDSMHSATSAKAKPRKTHFPDADEDDEDVRTSNPLAQQGFKSLMKNHWDAEEAGSDLDEISRMFNQGVNLTGRRQPETQQAKGYLSDYEKVKNRFRPSTIGANGSGDAKPAPQAAQPTSSADMQNMMMMYMMAQMKNQKGGDDEKTGKAFKKIRTMRGRVDDQPERIVESFITETMETLGAEDGDVWQLWMLTPKIAWGNMNGLQRMHFHLCHIMTLSLKARQPQAEAYMAQMLRALHQVALDGGSWSTASLMLPRKDPIFKDQFGASGEELEAIVAYQDAMKRLKTRGDRPEQTGGAKADEKGGKKTEEH